MMGAPISFKKTGQIDLAISIKKSANRYSDPVLLEWANRVDAAMLKTARIAGFQLMPADEIGPVWMATARKTP
jgi:hypothetical protein